MKISSENIERLLNQKNISPEKFGNILGMTGEGFRKLLKTGSTKESTVSAIAFHLGVHVDAITKKGSRIEFNRPGTAEDAVIKLQQEINRHERKINHLKDHIVKIYRAIGKGDEIDKINLDL